MVYQVLQYPAAQRDLDALASGTYERVAKKIRKLAQNPRPSGAEKVSGFEGVYRLRVGEYRIAYEIDDAARTVTLAAVGDRKDIYQLLQRRK